MRPEVRLGDENEQAKFPIIRLSTNPRSLLPFWPPRRPLHTHTHTLSHTLSIPLSPSLSSSLSLSLCLEKTIHCFLILATQEVTGRDTHPLSSYTGYAVTVPLTPLLTN